MTGIYVALSDGPPEGDAAGRHIWTNATLGMKAHIGVDKDSEAESFSVAGTQTLPAAVRGNRGGALTNCAARSRD